MQVIAVALKLDYYYYQNNPDSILVMVDRVKKISRRNNELKYFYFAWGKPIDYLLYQTTPNQHCHLRSPENASVSGG